MRRLIQLKEATGRKNRSTRQKKAGIASISETPLVPEVTLPEVALEAASDSVVAAVREEPLPFVMAEMALWGTAMSALVIPIGVAVMLASPFAIARDLWRSRGTGSEPMAV